MRDPTLRFNDASHIVNSERLNDCCSVIPRRATRQRPGLEFPSTTDGEAGYPTKPGGLV